MAENTRGRSRRAESPAHNSIACETCRSKKRRCDRALPFCLQCAHDPSQCNYPEQNKRGLPLGYVNKLEARLAETEAALFHALSEKHGDDHGVLPTFTNSKHGGQNKPDRVTEWENLPLQSTRQIDAWYQSKLRGIEEGEPTSPSATNSSTASRNRATRANLRRQLPRTQRSEGSQTHSATAPRKPTIYSPPPAVPHVGIGCGTHATDAEPTRAERLSQAQSNTYF